MSRQGRHFLLLLWKNFLLQKRKVKTTVFEIGLPTFFALILIFIRLRVTGEMEEKNVWRECNGWKQLSSTLPKNLSFTPDNEVTRKVMHHVVSQQIGIIGTQGLSSEDEMVRFLMFENATVNNTRDYLAGVVFSNSFSGNGSSSPKNIVYKLRFSSSPRNSKEIWKFGLNPYRMNNNWQTDFVFPLFQQVGPRTPDKTCGGPPGYAPEGFLAVQNAVNMAIIKVAERGTSPNMTPYADMSLIRHPDPAYNADNFILVIQQQFPLIIMLSFVLVALNVVKDVVHEKERKLKESMKMMGLNNWLHWTAWFVKYLLFLCITVGVMTLLLCVGTAKGPVIGKTDPSVVFVYLIVYSVSTISFCFAVSVFFSKANSGAAAGGFLFFVTYIPYFFIQPRYATFTWGQKLVSSLVSNVAMAYGGQIIGMFEGTGEGVQWSNIRRGASIDDNFSLFNVIMMMLADAVLYGMITWYVEAVFPGEYGVPQKWYFPFTCSYWCGTHSDEFVLEDKGRSIGQEFKNGGKKKVAVCGMTLDLYEGHITALLGHNGAGKTTTMSMLTGFIPTSSGTARVNGFDIRQDIANVRSSLGLCPQHDVLFDSLTVEEHLTFFARLKGYSLLRFGRGN
ncbi:phospholipid-transporting ATPase ABCA3-like isoform X2 [Dreissena polymorpha]|uniref:phospholipid-transporting ATPase ABCA3-like isoform X2 n=1 Tax=Dreissena polymorpha TaxID=45954 RepID=UPI002264D685|nr:phospholipid-transporting ATPase ABCA3-like isoform X2 [Dreissena polymorpha]